MVNNVLISTFQKFQFSQQERSFWYLLPSSKFYVLILKRLVPNNDIKKSCLCQIDKMGSDIFIMIYMQTNEIDR